jgi:hypothetical protein
MTVTLNVAATPKPYPHWRLLLLGTGLLLKSMTHDGDDTCCCYIQACCLCICTIAPQQCWVSVCCSLSSTRRQGVLLQGPGMLAPWHNC